MSNHFIVSPNGGEGWVVRRMGSQRILAQSRTKRQAESQGRSLAREARGVVSFRNSQGQFNGSARYN